jgi:Fe2+ transport system protein FeoA
MLPVPTPKPDMAPVPLTQLRRGAECTVHERQLDGEERELLSAMGLTERCRLRICRAGEPCIIQVASSRLGLSSSLACRILVHPSA